MASDDMKLPFKHQADIRDPVPVSMASIFDEIRVERARQDAKWGVQNHPCIYRGPGSRTVAERQAYADAMRQICEAHAANGTLCWEHIRNEEAAEADATTTTVDLREELIQEAAVIVAWIECIDRRSRGK